jgi:hypothetical protein
MVVKMSEKAEQELKYIELIYNELQRRGRMDKEAVAYTIGLTISDWNLRKSLALMKRTAEELEEIQCIKGTKGQYVLELEGWEELKREREKRLLCIDKLKLDIEKIIYDDNNIEWQEWAHLRTVWQLDYIAELVYGDWRGLNIGDSILLYRQNIRAEGKKKGKVAIYDINTDTETILKEIIRDYPISSIMTINIVLDFYRQSELERMGALKVLEKIKNERIEKNQLIKAVVEE